MSINRTSTSTTTRPSTPAKLAERAIREAEDALRAAMRLPDNSSEEIDTKEAAIAAARRQIQEAIAARQEAWAAVAAAKGEASRLRALDKEADVEIRLHRRLAAAQAATRRAMETRPWGSLTSRKVKDALAAARRAEAEAEAALAAFLAGPPQKVAEAAK